MCVCGGGGRGEASCPGGVGQDTPGYLAPGRQAARVVWGGTR